MILPEDCIREILEYLSEDKKSLYTCLFTNRLFCKCVIPILWRDPCSVRNEPWLECLSRTNYWKILGKTIIKCFSRETKQSLLKHHVFINPSLLQQPLFNYVSYIQFISEFKTKILIIDILKDVNIKILTQYETIKRLLFNECWSLFMNQCFKIKSIRSSSIELFFKHPRSNNSLSSLSTLECWNCSREILELLKNVHTLKHLLIFVGQTNDIEPLILSQNNLKEISFYYDSSVSQFPFKNRKTIKHLSQSLKILRFDRGICLSSQIISSFINLTELEINYKSSFSEENVQILEQVSLPKLEILSLKNVRGEFLDIYARLVDNTRNSLKVIDIHCTDSSISMAPSLESIKYYLHVIKTKCPNVEILPIWLISDISLKDFEDLLESCFKIKKIIIHILNSVSNSDTVLAKPIFYLLALKSSALLNDIHLIGRWSFSNLDIQDFFELWKAMKRKPLKFNFHNNIYSHYIIKVCEFYHQQGIVDGGTINYTKPCKYY
ncbi:7467_t:CDS:1 [Funneliformis geosporum]|uniref:16917_t:CDS:1 n=1 Tax=Funneliformis geosporum TaxID=1117311 RepID=A0A9W4WI89_9GLOM|nr:16917_t:CDS:1 [Funneliformis geosporum]CAI2167781.1 7467_t:CDS:1 [Funneliformis geosporum]